MPAYRSATIDLGDVAYHYVEAGAGPVLVLLHGWPETWYAWRHVIDALAPRFRVIAPDLRGLGDSSRPATGYDKATIAGDVVQLLDRLGVTAFDLAGHDWGGVVSYALARAEPQRVRKFAVLDVTVPGDGADGFSQGGKRWHHAFHRVAELPEALTAGREELYLRWFYNEWPVVREAFDDATVAEYLRTYGQPCAMSIKVLHRSVESAAAFFRISRSSRSDAFSRFNRQTSSSRDESAGSASTRPTCAAYFFRHTCRRVG